MKKKEKIWETNSCEYYLCRFETQWRYFIYIFYSFIACFMWIYAIPYHYIYSIFHFDRIEWIPWNRLKILCSWILLKEQKKTKVIKDNRNRGQFQKIKRKEWTKSSEDRWKNESAETTSQITYKYKYHDFLFVSLSTCFAFLIKRSAIQRFTLFVLFICSDR